jgi:transcriptional regulator with AAA-type ATPase domain
MQTNVETVDSEAAVETPTWVTRHQGLPRSVNIRRVRLEVVAGPDLGKSVELAQSAIVIGRTGGDFVLTDPKVSSMHAEIRLQAEGYRLRDLGSTNGTHIRGTRVVEAFIAPGTTIGIGKTAILFEPLDGAVEEPLWHEARLHGLVGGSTPMRHLYELINKYAVSDVTVLIQGETGCGKELVADAIHQCSRRAGGPFQVLDCSAIPEQLFEDQLFGHEQGAFTGAGRSTIGVFEAAHGGTLFLDEIGELPADVQAKLLRAVETRRVTRIGGTRPVTCNVRIVAATNRDLATEVNRGTFRADLFYRLAVARLHLPPLRERREDIPGLIEHFMRDLDPSGRTALSDEFLARAARHAWPGNVRELRNAIERAIVVPGHAAFDPPPKKESQLGEIDLDVPFKVAKQALIDEFDRRYLVALLEEHDHNIAAAARHAGIERMTIYKMIRRLGLDRKDEDEDADDDERETPRPVPQETVDDEGDTDHRR